MMAMTKTFLVLLLLCITLTLAKRQGKALSLFQIVRFSNDPCRGSGNLNGTCYTADECESRKGTNSGSCAQGYGVCCTFSLGCGKTSSENCTYFESTGVMTGACQLEICKSNDNICQLRLDFEQFTIAGPALDSTVATGVVGTTVFGVLNPAAGAASTLVSQCNTDTFSVSNPTGSAPPTICGNNMGEHMYVDASDSCNQLTFQLGDMMMGPAPVNRMWRIKVSQYSCDYNNLAPTGCTQYFFGENSQAVQTYNYNGGNGQHLANQDQNICVRTERGNCRICWYPTAVADFQVSGMTAAKAFAHSANGKFCCSYGPMGLTTHGGDCVSIPGARKTGPAASTKMPGIERRCGRSQGLAGTLNTGMSKTICSTRTPFNIRFLSDTYEFQTEGNNAGFRLVYAQDSTNCV